MEELGKAVDRLLELGVYRKSDFQGKNLKHQEIRHQVKKREKKWRRAHESKQAVMIAVDSRDLEKRRMDSTTDAF